MRNIKHAVFVLMLLGCLSVNASTASSSGVSPKDAARAAMQEKQYKSYLKGQEHLRLAKSRITTRDDSAQAAQVKLSMQDLSPDELARYAPTRPREKGKTYIEFNNRVFTPEEWAALQVTLQSTKAGWDVLTETRHYPATPPPTQSWGSWLKSFWSKA